MQISVGALAPGFLQHAHQKAAANGSGSQFPATYTQGTQASQLLALALVESKATVGIWGVKSELELSLSPLSVLPFLPLSPFPKNEYFLKTHKLQS